jgi:choline dehydrogenase
VHPRIGANLHDHPTAMIDIELAPSARAASADVPVACTFVRWQEQGVDDVAICPQDIRSDDPSRGGLMVALLQPRSRGELTLDAARFRLLAVEEDRARMRAAVRHAAELLRHGALAGVGRADLSFAALDDASLDVWLAEHTNGFVHAAGTCALGEVVDADCRVHGVEGLRVVDASIIPSLPRAAPYLTVLAVAELAAERILRNT